MIRGAADNHQMVSKHHRCITSQLKVNIQLLQPNLCTIHGSVPEYMQGSYLPTKALGGTGSHTCQRSSCSVQIRLQRISCIDKNIYGHNGRRPCSYLSGCGVSQQESPAVKATRDNLHTHCTHSKSSFGVPNMHIMG